MCKYHAVLFFPDAYDNYRPAGDRFEEILGEEKWQMITWMNHAQREVNTIGT